MAKSDFKAQVQQLREATIVSAVNRLLATKGYDLMTVDEVAFEAGIAKASVYKHFTSKEELAGAAMVRVLQQALAVVERVRADDSIKDAPAMALQAITRWAMQTQLEGEMPSLPTQNSALTASLANHKVYMDLLFALTDQLGAWITQAQQQAQIDPKLPSELVLYTLFACACNPVLGLMKSSGTHTDIQIVEWLLQTTFNGLKPQRTAV
jgi:TetR/AcrR family transcriptional regulator of autoinduction and epiphytic fitness